MRVRSFKNSIIKLICFIAIIGLFTGFMPGVFAAEPTWPRIKENGFRFKDSNEEDKWTVEVPVADNSGNVSQQMITFTSADITVINNSELLTTSTGQITDNKVGTIILDYGDKLILNPTAISQDARINLPKSNYTIDYDGDGKYDPMNNIPLTDGLFYDFRFFTDSNNRQIRYNYDVLVKGNNLLGTYPESWDYNEQEKTFVISIDGDNANLTAFSIYDKVIPTWGTQINKNTIDLSDGSDEIVLTNSIGEEETYTIKTESNNESAWHLVIPNKCGYNLSSLRVDNSLVAENVFLSILDVAETFSIRSKQHVEILVDPTGENSNKAIDNVLILTEDETPVTTRITGNLVSFVMPDANVSIISITFKETGTIGSSWPRIKDSDGFILSEDWDVELPVSHGLGDDFEEEKIAFESITVKNYDELGENNKVGTIVFNYGDLLITDPSGIGRKVRIRPGDYELVIEGDAEDAGKSLNLSTGILEDAEMLIADGVEYTYDLRVVGNNLLAGYNSSWLYDGDRSFEINLQNYDSSYSSYSIVNEILPTWGTSMDKTALDFSSGSAEVTLTNALKSETYTFNLVMPWQFSIPGRAGFNLAALKVGDEKLAGETSLEKLAGFLKYDIMAGESIELTVIPYGDDEGKIIDTITIVNEDDDPVDLSVNNNIVSFIMPKGNVRVVSITFKETDDTWFVINAVSNEYYEGASTGSISVIVNDKETVIACSGDSVSVSAVPKEHVVYDFVFSHWETEDVELTDEQAVSDTITFLMPEKKVNLTAIFEKKGVVVSFMAAPGNAVNSIGTFSVSQSVILSNILSQNGIIAKDIYSLGSKVSFILSETSNAYLFDGYSVIDQDGKKIPYELGPWQNVIFTIPETGVTSINVVAKFKAKEFSSITAKPNDASMGTVTASVNGSAITAAVLQDETVTLKAEPLSRYKFVSWDIAYEDGSSVDFEISDKTSNPATFVVPDNGKGIIVTGIFELDPEQMSTECDMLSVALFDGDTRYIAAKEGTAYTITVPKGTDPAALSAMVLKLTASEYATIRKSGDTQDWPAEGKACGMVVNTPVIFTVTAEDGKTSQDYTVTITETKSSEKEITAVRLLDSSNNSIAEGVLSGDTWTITLPADIDPTLASGIGSSTDVYMQIEYTGASVAQAGGYDDAGQTSWNTGTILCGVSVNSQKTFTVKAEDGSTRDYVIAISYTAPDAPTLTNGSAERTGERTAVVKFTSNQSGAYYYQVVEKGASANVDTSKNGSTAVAGENTINLSNLTADARDIYIVVKNAAGAESIPYKIEIPAYSSQDPEPGSYRITVSTPKGGTLTTNVTTANKGDSIIVTVTPDSGYQMVEGSLTYTMAVAGGETVKINGNRFTMPECDVTITCRWEESSSGGGNETPQEPGITSFIVQGVSGAISKNSDTEYTITLLMPHGTDVTKLAPVISTYGNVSVSPASGRVQDFSSPVTYTVTLEDGTKLKYKVTVYVSAGSKADQMWDKLADPHSQVFWWDYAKQQQLKGKYPKYW